MANESLVKRRMGITYYLMPWGRRKVRAQIARIAAIESELEAKAGDKSASKADEEESKIS
jgi:hypothetical protein